jgi:hypothetical protein
MGDKTCDTCERRQKAFARGKGCLAFIKKPDNCWAWTDDRDWERKVRVAVGRYKAMRGVL